MENIIVTGANEGIGFYLVKQLLLDGNNVTVLDININQLVELQKDFKNTLLPIICNVKDMDAMKEAVKISFDTFGYIDIAVSNACLCTFESLENTEIDTFKEVMDINFFGAVRLTKCVIPYMRHGGRIIITSSGVGVMGFVDISPYASSKGSIEAFAKCMNIEYKEKGISFHIFHPPLCKTKSASGLLVPDEFKMDPEKVGKGLAKNIHKKSYIICHSRLQKLQTLGCYLFPIRIGKFMSKMARAASTDNKS